jgi:hypothetical protein
MDFSVGRQSGLARAGTLKFDANTLQTPAVVIDMHRGAVPYVTTDLLASLECASGAVLSTNVSQMYGNSIPDCLF